MATLNTLRTRGGVIVSIVIAISLVAFLLGDLLSSGSSLFGGNKMRVGTINGQNIEYNEFSNDVDRFSNISRLMSGKDALTAEEQDAARGMVWDKLIMDYSFSPGFAALGLEASPAEQIDMTNGVYISPVIASSFANPQTGAYDPAFLKKFIDNLSTDQTGNTATLWGYLKEQMVGQRVVSKYIALVSKGIYTTNLEAENAVALDKNSYAIDYICKEYNTVADSTIKISQNQINDYYKSHKSSFKQGASTEIEYVAFDLLPSTEDYALAQKYIDDISAEFSASTTPMQYASLNSQVTPDQRYLSESQMEADIVSALWGKPSATYGPTLKGDTYTLARLSEMKAIPDSIGAKHILVPTTEKALADSIVTALKAGASFAELSTKHSVDKAAAQNGGDLGVFAPEQMIPQFSDACIAQSVGDIFTATTQYGIHIIELTKKSAPVQKAQIARITYKVEPSDATQQQVYSAASKFYTAAAGSYDNFKKSATDNALAKRVARIAAGDRSINGLAESRELVRWSFNAAEGDVSTILEIDGNYVVAALTASRQSGIAPVEQVAEFIRTKLIREAKVKMFAEQMTGSSLSDVASKVQGEVKSAVDIAFESFYVDGIGAEPKLIGAVCGLDKVSTLSKPVDGATGVYLFSITNVAPKEGITLQSEKVRLEAMAQSYVNERVNQAMYDASEITDNRSKFF